MTSNQHDFELGLSGLTNPVEPEDVNDDDERGELTTQRHIPRVLVVEDSAELGDLVKRSLERANMLALHELSGHDALGRLETFHPDLVLLDINLPDMTGWEVLDAIKESTNRLQRPGIIIVSAYGDPANRLLGRLQGVDDFVVKPFSSDEIVRVVREVLEKRRLRKHQTKE